MSRVANVGVPGLEWWQRALLFTLLPLGLTAPFGTTILGWVAVTQIRRSGGRLYGLGGLAAVIVVVTIISALSNGPLHRLFYRGNAQLADTDAASGAFVARLPGGGTIELLGVSDPDPAPNGWCADFWWLE